MKFRTALILGALLAVISPGFAFAQGFQGGLRGSIKDSGGVVPGVEVTLTNESTNVGRSTTTNERGEYVFAAVDPGTYKLKASLQGYKTIEQGAIPHRHAAVPHHGPDDGSGPPRGEHYGDRRGADHRDVERVAGHGARRGVAAVAAVSRPRRLHDRHHGADGGADRRHAVQPPAGSDQRLAAVARRRHAPRQQLHAGRRADHRHAEPRRREPDHRSARGHEGPGAHLRRRNGRDRRRRVQHDAQNPAPTCSAAPASIRRGRSRCRRTISSATRPVCAKPNNPYYLGGFGFGGPIKKNRTFFWVAGEDYTDTQTRNAAEIMPTALERAGDFSRTTNAAGVPVVIYDPLTRQPFPGNVIPQNRLNPVALNMLKYLPAADTQVSNGSANYNRTSLIKSKLDAGIHRQGRTQVQRQGFVDRFLSLQPL